MFQKTMMHGCLALLVLLFSLESSTMVQNYSVPPQFPPEFIASFYQHKWDVNVNHSSTGIWYTSSVQNKVRVDQSTQAVDRPGSGNILQSILDFSQNMNFLLTLTSQGPNCSTYPIIGYFPLYPTLLSDRKAVYAGRLNVEHPIHLGECDRWTIFLPSESRTVVTFFFSLETGLPVRFDAVVGDDKRTAFNTYFWNIQVMSLSPDVFNSFCTKEEVDVHIDVF
eukprot:TRINITY_DN14102_c0_g1_i4.p1 TRINITY_DN14102_c0_g1~~TRINITY_DN14102_c0_g1_i4.p1  ORF type:complete len:223 (+),score=16.28 TRINITY_DN14102_c0_g1_i4:354-1022(+)